MSEELFKKSSKALQKYWGYDSFRPGQEDAIRSVLAGRDTVILFPTGGGKSLCYQLPASVLEGVTVVISPLVALMQDQVQQLNELGISATFVNSTLPSWEVEQRLVNARNGMYKLLYCSPERLKTTLWKAELPRLDISLVAIDEAHCISEWGHDFRPSYREIRESLEPVAESAGWIALTATATPEVRKDIIENLEFEDPKIVSRGFERPNLKWWVVTTEKKREKLLQSVRRASAKGPGLIYGGTRKNCEELSQMISRKIGVKARPYHAGVDSETRKEVQQQWLDGELPVVVATNAFGMGIDKADCRYVIHYQMPYSLEAYYQEAGRSGRDGRESYPILIYKASDLYVAEKRLKDSYPEKEQLQKTYDALCDTFELAVNTEMETMEQISIQALSTRADLSERVVTSSLKVLKHLGIIQLIEDIEPKVGLRFVLSEDNVRDKIHQLENSRKAEFLDTLFRQFGTESFAGMKYLEMDYLQRKLDLSENAVIKGLHVLQAHDHLLNFEYLGERPLVKLLDARFSTLPFGRARLEKHRNSLLKKLEYMEGYIETKQCREVYIRHYFGEKNIEPCGHCDNCLNTSFPEEPELTEEELNAIREALDGGGKSLKELQRITKWSRRRIKRSLSHLMRENKVDSDTGKYHWINTS